MFEKIRILLVDDNEDERLFMKEGSTAWGFYEVVAETGSGDKWLGLIAILPVSILPSPRLFG